MFPLEFPYRHLRKAKAGDVVLDPFCGRGTTLFAGRLRGLETHGIDINPVAVAIASAKLSASRPLSLIKLCESILRNPPKAIDIPDGDFWELCYHPATLIEICILRSYLNEHRTKDCRALQALILGILHGPLMKGAPSYLSNQMPRTYATKPDAAVNFWDKYALKPRRVDVLEAVKRRAQYVFQQVPKKTEGSVQRGDVRKIDISSKMKAKASWVITSPPYGGMDTYISDQWLRNWFLGSADDVHYEQKGQLGGTQRKHLSRELGTVWSQMAAVCRKRAKLIIRFGALPSFAENPRKVISDSISLSGAGWRIQTMVDAGISPKGSRQASQFWVSMDEALDEVDVFATLEC